MSPKAILYSVLALIVLIGLVPLMGKIGQEVGEIPVPTAIDVPSALRKTDESFASSSAETQIATPSNIHY